MYHSPRPYGYQQSHRGRGHGRYTGHSGHRPRPKTHFNLAVPFSTNKNNEEHWCETCDRGFSTVEELDRHKQQHQKCNIDGCQFVAHPKVITKHIQMQHSSGLYKKISKLDNPEDIQKWREERKKKYPTKINIDKKAAEIKEKVERGEKMALKQKNRQQSYKSAPNSQNTGQTRGHKRKHGFDKNKQNHKHYDNNNRFKTNHQPNNKGPPARKVPKIVPKIPNITEKNNLKPFTGILSIVMNDNDADDINNKLDMSHSLIEDDYYESPIPCEEKIPLQEPSRCAALTLLMCDYESSEDEANGKENTSDTRTDKQIDNTHSDMKRLGIVAEGSIEKNNICVNGEVQERVTNDPKKKCSDNLQNSDDDSGPEEIKCVNNVVEADLLQETNVTLKEAKTFAKQPVKPKNARTPKYRHTVPSTLLQKLLHKEIRHERNIVLQCIRYIKRMDYFDKKAQ